METRLKVISRVLVFGNDNYESNPPLQCSINDAEDISETFREIGFEVTIGYDQTYAEMKDAIQKFEASIRKQDRVVLYFSGHGIDWKNNTYLLPVDCEDLRENPELCQNQSINVKETLESIRNRSSSVIIFLLDCCRNSNDENEGSLTNLSNIKLSPDSLIFYACGPAQSAIDTSPNARNSLFTYHILEHLWKPELQVSQVMCAVTNACCIDATSAHTPHTLGTLRTTEIYFNTEKILRPRVSPPYPARWNPHSTIVAGGNGQGGGINQLNRPCGLFVDVDRTVYVADCWNNRIVAWKMNAKEVIVIAGGNDTGDRLDQLNIPIDVTMDFKTRCLLVSDHGNQRIMSFSSQHNDRPNEGKIIVNNINCWGLAMDNRRSLYVSDPMKHEVRRYDAENYERSTVVAGGHGQGDELHQLNGPTHLFVDDQLTLYIADVHNHRVVKWPQGASKGIVVAGGNGKGDALNQLRWPRGIWVDGFRHVYVADSDNDGVVRYDEFLERQTIIIDRDEHNPRKPHGIFFDRDGHLYFVDNHNSRVQCFERIK